MCETGRFGGFSMDRVDNEILNNIPFNTVKTHKSIWNQFMLFCQEKEYEFDAHTPVEHIALILKDWAYNMRKKDGDDYKENVVKTIWNITAKKIQEMYFNDFKISFDPFKDIAFKSSRDARNSKRRELQKNPNKRRTSSAALDIDDHNKIILLWNEDEPAGLQRKFFHIISVELAWRGGEAAKCLINYFREEMNIRGQPTGNK